MRTRLHSEFPANRKEQGISCDLQRRRPEGSTKAKTGEPVTSYFPVLRSREFLALSRESGKYQQGFWNAFGALKLLRTEAATRRYVRPVTTGAIEPATEA